MPLTGVYMQLPTLSQGLLQFTNNQYTYLPSTSISRENRQFGTFTNLKLYFGSTSNSAFAGRFLDMPFVNQYEMVLTATS